MDNIIIEDFKFSDSLVGTIVYNDVSKTHSALILYHGWSQDSKSQGLIEIAKRLAKANILVILPDADMHGQRQGNKKRKGIHLWPVVLASIDEFKKYKSELEQRYQISANKIAVGGFSMGAITSLAIFKTDESINSCLSIAGTPNPIGYSSYLIKNDLLTHKQKVTFDNQCHHLPPISLVEQPSAINKRPLHFIAGELDENIPYQESYDFYHQVKDQDYGLKTTYDLMKNTAHEINEEIIQLSVNYILNDLLD